MKLLEPVMWNSMKLTSVASDPMISLVLACCLLSVPETQQRLLLLPFCTISKHYMVVSTKKTSSARGQQQFLVVGCKEEA